MAATYSDRLRLTKQGDGDNPNSWGTVANLVFDLIDEAIGGHTIVSVSGAGITLTSNNGASDQARNMILAIRGTLTANTTITIPSSEKLYYVDEGSSGSFATIFKTAAGTAVTVTQGANCLLACDGTNLVCLEGVTGNLGNLSATNTGLALLTASNATAALALLSGVDLETAQTISGKKTFSAELVTADVSVGGEMKLSGKVSAAGQEIDSGIYTQSSQKYVNLGAVSATTTVDYSAGEIFACTVAGSTTFVFANAPSGTVASSFSIRLTNAGASTITWSNTINWANSDTEPTWTTVGSDWASFITINNGTSYDGLANGTGF